MEEPKRCLLLSDSDDGREYFEMSNIRDEIFDVNQSIEEARRREKKVNKYIVIADPHDTSLGGYATQRVVHNSLDAALVAAKSMSKKNRAAYFVAKLTHKVELVDVAVTELEDRD